MRPATSSHPWGTRKLFFRLSTLVQESASSISDTINLFSLSITHTHKATVLQHLQCRIDRARTGCIKTTRFLFQRLHHFIAIHGSLLQQLQQSKLHITAPKKAWPFTTRPKGTATTKRPASAM